MRTHIDWLTFTMGMAYADETTSAYANAIAYGFEDMFGADLRAEAFGGDWEKQERSRAPYTDAWVVKGGGITLFASPNLTHCCIEISGQGCERLIAADLLQKVLAACHERVTRIDIASDIETKISPDEFVEKVDHERMRSSGSQHSDTGDTCYVGSQKSDRYARVYRYSEPHPRAHLLRVEHVFRKEYAKKVAIQCTNTTLDGIAKSAGLAFGWSHAVWKTDQVEGVDISVVSERRNTGKTVHWLIDSAAASFKRLCADGTIKDPEDFLRRYFLPET